MHACSWGRRMRSRCHANKVPRWRFSTLQRFVPTFPQRILMRSCGWFEESINAPKRFPNLAGTVFGTREMNTPKIGKTTYVVVYRVKREEIQIYGFCQNAGHWCHLGRGFRMRKSDTDVTLASEPTGIGMQPLVKPVPRKQTFIKVAHFDSCMISRVVASRRLCQSLCLKTISSAWAIVRWKRRTGKPRNRNANSV